MSFVDIQDEAFVVLALHDSPLTKEGSSAHKDAESHPLAKDSDSSVLRSDRRIEEPALRQGGNVTLLDRLEWYVPVFCQLTRISS
jgi:hypothetical protein